MCLLQRYLFHWVLGRYLFHWALERRLRGALIVTQGRTLTKLVGYETSSVSIARLTGTLLHTAPNRALGGAEMMTDGQMDRDAVAVEGAQRRARRLRMFAHSVGALATSWQNVMIFLT